MTICSPSGDTDIIVMAVTILNNFKERVSLIDGHGKDRKYIELSEIELEEPILSSLIGFHALTGNDFVSSFFRKGKKKCFGIFEKKFKVQKALMLLGDSCELKEDVFTPLEEYVCALYGSKKKKVDEVRYDIFYKKYSNENKTVDMSILPPCQSVLKLLVLRACYVSAMWKKSVEAKPILPSISSCR